MWSVFQEKEKKNNFHNKNKVFAQTIRMWRCCVIRLLVLGAKCVR